jgi:hypothetical protein
MSRNPYHASGKTPTLIRSVFVFMDLLGYSALIEQSKLDGNQQEVLELLHGALMGGRTWLEEKHLPSEFRELSEKDDYSLKAFTDNIVIGWPIRDDAESEFGNAFFKLAMFQFNMVTSGFFIRGAISAGEAYVDDVAVFGEALTEAHDGESCLARDPRIILVPSAVTTVQKHLCYYTPSINAPHVRDILRDSDGQWFLNYLDCVLIAESEQGPFYDELLKHKAVVEERLSKYKEHPGIWSKYAWVAGYHNFFCDLHSHHFNDDHKIKVDLFRASPSLIV